MVKTWTYRRAIGYLNSFLDYERIPEPRERTTEEDLERFRSLLSSLGDPHKRYPVIHIVGTKGKGSTAALLASILKYSGYRVGLFTSPHLISVRERIVVDGKPITKGEMAEILMILRDIFTPFKPYSLSFRTVFEHLTAGAFLFFARKGVDIAVVEAGMGAKLDATNVVDPLLVIMTPIGLDHTLVLGSTVREIAQDKSFAIKERTVVVSAPQSSDCEEVIRDRCKRTNSILHFAPSEERFQILKEDWKGSYLRCLDRWRSLNRFLLPLAGYFQYINLSTVLTAVEVLGTRGIKVNSETVKRGIRRTRWLGRLQMVQKSPLVILDGAHNTLSIQALVKAVKRIDPDRTWRCVFSTIVGKPTEEMLGLLKPIARHIFLTPLIFPKGVKQEFWAQVAAREKGVMSVTSSVPQALQMAIKDCPPNEGVLVTGSLYLIGEAIRFLKGLPPPPLNGDIDPFH